MKPRGYKQRRAVGRYARTLKRANAGSKHAASLLDKRRRRVVRSGIKAEEDFLMTGNTAKKRRRTVRRATRYNRDRKKG